jgi:hypothetical protein
VLVKLVHAAIDEAEHCSRLPHAVQYERANRVQRGRQVGRWPGPASGPEPIPGARKFVELAFTLLQTKVLTLTTAAARLQVPGFDVTYTPGLRSLEYLGGLFSPEWLAVGQQVEAALAGKPIDIGKGRFLRLVASNPFPRVVYDGGALHVAFVSGTEVAAGGKTARLKGATVYHDRAVVEIEWRFLGIDLARDPVVWFGE